MVIARDPRPRQTRNPKFQEESLDQVSWTQTVKGKFPEHQDCAICGKMVKRTEIVVTVPIRDVRSQLVYTSVLHRTCLVSFLDKVPDDDLITQVKVDKIVKRFTKVN